MPYHLDLTLQQRATLSIAISIWNRREVKDKIRKLFPNLQILPIHDTNREWKQFIKEVVEEVNQYVLPSQLRDELIHVIKTLGKKIYNWYKHIQNECYKFDKKDNIINYIDEIYWTPIGTIDEVEILQSYWMKNTNLNNAVLYNIACKNALEEDIDYLWQKIPFKIKDGYDYSVIMPHGYENNDSFYRNQPHGHFILDYWKYRRNDRMNHFKNFILPNLFRNERRQVVYNQNYSIEHNMFLLSVDKGHSAVAKYFWKKLTQEEKDNSLLYSALIAVNRGSNTDNITDYKREKYVEILIFLINQMTMNQKESFLRGKSVPEDERNFYIKEMQKKIFFLLLFIWPWQELFLPVLRDMLQYLGHNKEPVLEALFRISEKIVNPSFDAENYKYRSIFHEAWFIIPGSIKQTMIPNDPNFCFSHNFMVNLLKVEDFGSIKMIFDDPEITDVKIDYIKFGQKGYESLIISGKYGFLNQFMEKVLRFEEEKKYFKSIINHIDICKYFMESEKYDLADEFLNWRFAMVEEKKQVKDYFRNHVFSIKWIFNTLKLCGGSVDEAKKQTSGFLEWMLESEDDIARFRKEFITNSEPLIEKEVCGDFSIRTLFEEEAQEIREILEYSNFSGNLKSFFYNHFHFFLIYP